MSEPVSNAEIEDVLSSIRRLVSENAGAGRRGDAAQGAPEKLVLTPAFRIDEGEAEDASVAAEESEVVSLDRDRWTDGGPEAVEEAVAAAVEDLAGVQVDDEGADPVAQAGEDTAIESPPSDDAAEFDPATDAAPESYQSELERRIAELEAVIARSASDFEPDGSEDDAMDDPVMFHHGVEMAEAEPENDMDAPVDDAADEAGDRTRPWTAESFATPGETGQPEFADDETGATDEAPAEELASFEDDLVTPEALHAAGEAGAADAWEDVEPTDEPGEDEDAEAVLDEDALREMVSRMVREELQGSVGERITHNVRRMVRREIARALALQDFE
ncbi:hypothetical protein [Sinisalibacter lacisalsi]|nr:hypothetical protein [Sinisalibacter lacisalsi]